VNDHATKASVELAKCLSRQGVIADKFGKRSFAANVVLRRQVDDSPKKKAMHLKFFRNGMAYSIAATFVGVPLTVESTNARNHATHKRRISFIAHDPQT